MAGIRKATAVTALLLIVAAAQAVLAVRPVSAPVGDSGTIEDIDKRKPPSKFHFRSPKGWFIQERASKQLPGPGQHFAFGALKSWDEIHQFLDNTPSAKLLLLVRHGQAVSNWLGDTLGPDVWFDVEEKCSYTNDNGTTYGVFDADLTELGQNEAKSLNGMLDNSGWFKNLTGGRSAAALVSPLSRCLQTSSIVLDGLPIASVQVEENIRETLGEDTCDARRSKSDPDPDSPEELQGPCDFQDGLASTYPKLSFPIVDEYQRDLVRQGLLTRRKDKGKDKEHGLGFGLLHDRDVMWTTKREGQKHQVKRAVNFLFDVFEYVDERVVVVITHSGTVRSILLAAGREPYHPENTELVPAIVVPAYPEPAANGGLMQE